MRRALAGVILGLSIVSSLGFGCPAKAQATQTEDARAENAAIAGSTEDAPKSKR